MNPSQLVLHWCCLTLMATTTFVCMVTTVRVYWEDWVFLVLLYPGGVLLWGCLAWSVVGLIHYTTQEVINRRVS